MEVAIITGGET